MRVDLTSDGLPTMTGRLAPAPSVRVASEVVGLCKANAA